MHRSGGSFLWCGKRRYHDSRQPQTAPITHREFIVLWNPIASLQSNGDLALYYRYCILYWVHVSLVRYPCTPMPGMDSMARAARGIAIATPCQAARLGMRNEPVRCPWRGKWQNLGKLENWKPGFLLQVARLREPTNQPKPITDWFTWIIERVQLQKLKSFSYKMNRLILKTIINNSNIWTILPFKRSIAMHNLLLFFFCGMRNIFVWSLASWKDNSKSNFNSIASLHLVKQNVTFPPFFKIKIRSSTCRKIEAYSISKCKKNGKMHWHIIVLQYLHVYTLCTQEGTRVLCF